MAPLFALVIAASAAAPASAALTGPLADLQAKLSALSLHASGHVGIVVEDLTTGTITAVNGHADMPAASTIKVPVMVEVFRQMALGKIDLERTVSLQSSDRDWGWGDLADAPLGTEYSVQRLLDLMITESDNTATNMLIRLVGRQHINTTMRSLGLTETRVGDYIRSESSGAIRSLRTSPYDMVKLLDAIAREEVIDSWSCREMVAILSDQHHNTLLPEPLPPGLQIAHKTGTLSDTLNDVGIVYLDREPYVIAVMTTQLPDLDDGRTFIRSVSRLTYQTFNHVADWRSAQAQTAPAPGLTVTGFENKADSIAPRAADPVAPKGKPAASYDWEQQ